MPRHLAHVLACPSRWPLPRRCPQFIEARLDKQTAELAHGCSAVCLFVNDACDGEVRRTARKPMTALHEAQRGSTLSMHDAHAVTTRCRLCRLGCAQSHPPAAAPHPTQPPTPAPPPLHTGQVLEVLAKAGVKFIAMRCAGFDKASAG